MDTTRGVSNVPRTTCEPISAIIDFHNHPNTLLENYFSDQERCCIKIINIKNYILNQVYLLSNRHVIMNSKDPKQIFCHHALVSCSHLIFELASPETRHKNIQALVEKINSLASYLYHEAYQDANIPEIDQIFSASASLVYCSKELHSLILPASDASPVQKCSILASLAQNMQRLIFEYQVVVSNKFYIESKTYSDVQHNNQSLQRPSRLSFNKHPQPIKIVDLT
jgi:hypothetical protein